VINCAKKSVQCFWGSSARVRHFYDIAKLLNVTEVVNYLTSDNFLEILKEIYNNDLNTPEFCQDWTNTDLSQNNIFIKFEEILRYIKPHFESQFRTLLYSREKFEFDEINESFEQIEKVLGSFDFSRT
jgi:predicted transcriptional regulator